MSKIGAGYLGKNRYKDNEKKPDYIGKATINGEKVDLAGWINTNEHGKYISLGISTPYERTDNPPREEDVPF